jgi:hypothetical protein
MNASEALSAAAREVESGWARMTYKTCNGELCSIGALRKVIFGKVHPTMDELEQYPLNAIYRQAQSALRKTMCEQFDPDRTIPPKQNDPSTIALINDVFASNKEEIIACMEKAAIEVENEPDQIRPVRLRGVQC